MEKIFLGRAAVCNLLGEKDVQNSNWGKKDIGTYLC